MIRVRNLIIACAAATTLAACATTPVQGPAEVTRFHDAAGLTAISGGTFFVEAAPDSEPNALAIAPYKAAVAAELEKLGYAESVRSDARTIVQVKVDRFTVDGDQPRRGPVSVGVGGSTGSYGSGVGLGIGINLGGGRSKERVGTELSVMIRDVQTNRAVWEGRAQLETARGSIAAEPTTNAQLITEAIFREFPGGNGETIEVEVSE